MTVRSIVHTAQMATVMGSQAMTIGSQKNPATAIAAMAATHAQFNRTSSRRRSGVRHESRLPEIRSTVFS